MFSNKYTAEKVPFSFKFIPYYFFILILIFFIPLFYIDISINIEKTGKIFISNKKNNLIFSEYSGIVEEIYIKEDEFIKEGDIIAKLKINQNQVKIDNQINYLESKYQDNKEEDIKNQITSLKKLKPYRFLISNKNGNINDIFIQNGQEIKNFDKLLILNSKKDFFIESTFSIEETERLSVNKNVYLKFENEKKYYIGTITEIYPTKNSPSFYNIKVKPFKIEERLLIENKKIKIIVPDQEYSFFDWFLLNIKV